MKRYFITGTDTDCGKTYVTTQLIDFFSNSAAIKPIASGCTLISNELVNSDAQKLQERCNLSMEQINPWRFKSPISPHLAAQEESAKLVVQEIADYCMNMQLLGVEYLFIEGAGGLMVPLNNDETWVDFLKHTKIPVILVVGMKLGCLNHALLTASVLNSHELVCAGWIANCIDPKMLALDENITTLKNLLPFPLLATVPYSSPISDLHLCKL